MLSGFDGDDIDTKGNHWRLSLNGWSLKMLRDKFFIGLNIALFTQ